MQNNKNRCKLIYDTSWNKNVFEKNNGKSVYTQVLSKDILHVFMRKSMNITLCYNGLDSVVVYSHMLPPTNGVSVTKNDYIRRSDDLLGSRDGFVVELCQPIQHSCWRQMGIVVNTTIHIFNVDYIFVVIMLPQAT